ncbi:MAG: SH3 domain-containing protein, partial [Clostridiaceae bacterium]|nr:SH3 domain-containing protein [Clostridiaceae bacterium]
MKFKQLKSKQTNTLLIAAVLSVVIAAPVMSQPLGLTTIMTTSVPSQASPVIEDAEVQPEANLLAAPEGIDNVGDGLSRSQSENALITAETEEIQTTTQTQSDATEPEKAEPTASPEPEVTTPAYTGPEFEPQDKVLYVSASELNMRQSFSAEANILEKIPMGKKIKCIGESEEWLRIEYNGRTGYIASEYTSAEMVFVPVEQTRYVDASGLNVRSQPNSEAEVVTKLSQDDKVTRIGVGDGWSLIKTAGGKEGYVSSKYLTPDVPASVLAAQEAARQAQQTANQTKSKPAPASNPGSVVGNADIS